MHNLWSIEVNSAEFLRRAQAAKYLRENYGFGSTALLAKAACHGQGPPYRRVGNVAIYTLISLDSWAQSRICASELSSSSREKL